MVHSKQLVSVSSDVTRIHPEWHILTCDLQLYYLLQTDDFHEYVQHHNALQETCININRYNVNFQDCKQSEVKCINSTIWLCVMVIAFNATFNNISVIIMAVSFIGGGNFSTRRKPPTCCKSLTNFIT